MKTLIERIDEEISQYFHDNRGPYPSEQELRHLRANLWKEAKAFVTAEQWSEIEESIISIARHYYSLGYAMRKTEELIPTT